MLRNSIIIFIFSFVLSGCSFYSIDSQDTTLDFYPPKPSADKVAYLEKVDQPHEVIGIVTVDTERSRPFEEIVAKMKYEAAVLGGDAITDVRRDTGDSSSSKMKEFLSRSSIRIRYTAKVVLFK
jgi:hypothetical protein